MSIPTSVCRQTSFHNGVADGPLHLNYAKLSGVLPGRKLGEGTSDHKSIKTGTSSEVVWRWPRPHTQRERDTKKYLAMKRQEFVEQKKRAIPTARRAKPVTP